MLSQNPYFKTMPFRSESADRHLSGLVAIQSHGNKQRGFHQFFSLVKRWSYYILFCILNGFEFGDWEEFSKLDFSLKQTVNRYALARYKTD